MNHPIFHKIEIDNENIESFIREGFERKLGKENVLDIRFLAYPDEYIAAVTLRNKTKEALNIAHELKGIFLDNNLAVGIYTKEAH